MRRTRLNGTRGGFTLIELAVTLLVIGVMAGMLVPRLPDLGQWRLNSAARRLAGSVTHVYDQSVATQLVYRLTLDMEKGAYYVSLLNTENQFEKTELPFVKEARLPDNVKIAGADTAGQGAVTKGKAAIHFFPTGFAEFSYIHLEDRNGHELTLAVNPLTGRVKILQGRREMKLQTATTAFYRGVAS